MNCWIRYRILCKVGINSLFVCFLLKHAQFRMNGVQLEILVIMQMETKHLKKSNAACFYTPIVLKLLIVVQM